MIDLLADDAASRLLALELRSFIVEAPAGAGKTELLTQRYLKLLSIVNAPEEIVALTFTNKATAEMRSRILQSLQDAADNIQIEPDKPHKQQTRVLAMGVLKRDVALGWNLLEQPARLRIQTIDALCGNLTQQMPLLSRFGGQPALADDAKPYYIEAAQRTLANVAMEANGDAPISVVLAFMQNQAEKLTKLLADMLAKRDQWLLPLGEHAETAEIAHQTKLVIEYLAQLNPADNLPAISPLEMEENAKLVAAFAATLKLAAAHLWTLFQVENVVDFVEVTRSAIDALNNPDGPTDLALRLDYRISHLLVDEFQDTSPTQIALLRGLTQGWEEGDGRTLFCVGDPMQSIYRFRKADVGEFLNARLHGIGHVRLQPLKLSLNNRSRPEVLQWINQCFVQIFPPYDQPEAAAIAYRPCTPKLEANNDAGVRVHALVTDGNNESMKHAEAHHVANLIAQEQNTKPEQTIAVLVRSRTHLQQLVSVMRRDYSHIKFQALEIEALSDRQTVLDALSMTRALLHKADRVHWLSLLRAPWCGLKLADLHTLCADQPRATIWKLIQDEARLEKLSQDGRTRLKRLHAVLAHAFSAQGRQPLRRWLENTWLHLGGGSTLLNAGDIRDVVAFFDLVEKNAKGYMLDFAQLDTAMESLYAKPDAGAGEKLQFLTIHKSKGLEFDCVILPSLNAQARHEDKPLLLWQEFEVNNHLCLLAAPLRKANKERAPGLYDYLYKLEQTRSHHETARLLYVATTRAKERLHLIGSIIENKKGERKPHSSSLLNQLWPCVQNDFINVEKKPQFDVKSSDFSKFSSHLLRLSDVDLQKTVAAFDNSVAPQANIHESSGGVSDEDASLNLEADMGTLAHLYMDMLATDNITKGQIDTAHSAMQRWLMQKGHDSEKSHAATSQVIRALQTTLNSNDGEWILKKHDSAHSELALTSADGKQHVIDRTFIENQVNNQKIRWIIDYKLGLEVTDNNAHAVAQTHKPQLVRYAGLFSDENLLIKQAIFFISIGRLVEII